VPLSAVCGIDLTLRLRWHALRNLTAVSPKSLNAVGETMMAFLADL
jgi:hypothetical protein